jgi:glycosyltransferase involved in cell wall biosynthesis
LNPGNHKAIKVLIIVPCYNEEKRLQTNSFVQFAIDNPNIHFLFVDDGSRDETAVVLKELCDKLKHSDCLILDSNVGKAEAIRSGVLSLYEKSEDYEFIGYLDADLSTPLDEIIDFLEVIGKNGNIRFLMGIRVARMGAKVHRKKSRHYIGRIFATAVSLLLREPIYDSQCGAKLIHSSVADELFREKFITKWLFDVELIFRLKALSPDFKDIIFEHPLKKWTDVGGSKLKTKDFLNAPVELFRIWRRYR